MLPRFGLAGRPIGRSPERLQARAPPAGRRLARRVGRLLTRPTPTPAAEVGMRERVRVLYLTRPDPVRPGGPATRSGGPVAKEVGVIGR